MAGLKGLLQLLFLSRRPILNLLGREEQRFLGSGESPLILFLVSVHSSFSASLRSSSPFFITDLEANSAGLFLASLSCLIYRSCSLCYILGMSFEMLYLFYRAAWMSLWALDWLKFGAYFLDLAGTIGDFFLLSWSSFFIEYCKFFNFSIVLGIFLLCWGSVLKCSSERLIGSSPLMICCLFLL